MIMITKDDISITGCDPNYELAQSISDNFGKNIFVSLDVEFILFSSIICKCTIYKDLKTEDEIHNEIVNYINSKITK